MSNAATKLPHELLHECLLKVPRWMLDRGDNHGGLCIIRWALTRFANQANELSGMVIPVDASGRPLRSDGSDFLSRPGVNGENYSVYAYKVTALLALGWSLDALLPLTFDDFRKTIECATHHSELPYLQLQSVYFTSSTAFAGSETPLPFDNAKFWAASLDSAAKLGALMSEKAKELRLTNPEPEPTAPMRTLKDLDREYRLKQAEERNRRSQLPPLTDPLDPLGDVFGLLKWSADV